MRQLKERITHSFNLLPLPARDIKDYLGFRLRAAGYKGPGLFSKEALALIAEASAGYASGEGELPLLRAYFLAPEQLVVLVGMYRYYFYQHRLGDADQVARRAMAVAGERLDFPADWRRLDARGLGAGIRHSMGLARFWLMSLKARAILDRASL